MACNGLDRRGGEWRGRLGQEWTGPVRQGIAGLDRTATVRPVADSFGRNGVTFLGLAVCG